MRIALASSSQSVRKSEETFMRSLIILSIVVLLKIEQELTRRPAKPAAPRRNRTSVLRR
jgi:hypothetical protein